MDQKYDMINRDRMWRNVICLNPNHETVKFETNEIGNIFCPICQNIMVVEIKTGLKKEDYDRQK